MDETLFNKDLGAAEGGPWMSEDRLATFLDEEYGSKYSMNDKPSESEKYFTATIFDSPVDVAKDWFSSLANWSPGKSFISSGSMGRDIKDGGFYIPRPGDQGKSVTSWGNPIKPTGKSSLTSQLKGNTKLLKQNPYEFMQAQKAAAKKEREDKNKAWLGGKQNQVWKEDAIKLENPLWALNPFK